MANVKEKRLTRREVPEELTWDLTDLFQSSAEWETELQSVQQDLPEITTFKGKFKESAQTLSSCLIELEKLQQRLIRVATYASLRQAGDGNRSGQSS